MKSGNNILLVMMTMFFFCISSNVSACDNMHNMKLDTDTTATLSIAEAKKLLKDDSFMYFDVSHIADSINACGGKMLYFLDWLFKSVKGMNGTYGLLEKHIRTMNPDFDDLFDQVGPSFKHRPIIWFVDDKFLALTGTRSHNVRYKARCAYEKDLSLMMNKVSKVYISKQNNVWNPWFEYDNLSDVRPFTVFIYTKKSMVLR